MSKECQEKKICVLGIGNDKSILAFLKESLNINLDENNRFTTYFFTPKENYCIKFLYDYVSVNFLLQIWSVEIAKADIIFVVAPKSQRKEIISGLLMHENLENKAIHVFCAPGEEAEDINSVKYGNAEQLKKIFNDAIRKRVVRNFSLSSPPPTVSKKQAESKKAQCSTGGALAIASTALVGLTIVGILTYSPAVIALIAGSAVIVLLLLISSILKCRPNQGVVSLYNSDELL